MIILELRLFITQSRIYEIINITVQYIAIKTLLFLGVTHLKVLFVIPSVSFTYYMIEYIKYRYIIFI